MRKTLAETTPASTATSSTLTVPATSSGNYQASPSPDVTISPPSTPPAQDSTVPSGSPAPAPKEYPLPLPPLQEPALRY